MNKSDFLHRRYLQKGFSLTELMISIIIIGVLVGIVIPNYNNIRFGADENKARGNLHSIYMAQKECRADTQTYGDDLTTLQTYVDFSVDDGSWSYQINSATANTFQIQANSAIFPGRWMQMNETGTLSDNY